ncbi:dephospho-CoA kinase [Utexia brackfieldae]|uniref:dephospho-CoA kinase n=1 Tax=Utexia brackfieldae TaxID=3074108 RepID=UPI00370DE19A
MSKKPLIVALTGGVASGKSTVERLFSQLGVPIVDADKISRQVVEKGQPALHQLVDHFGSSILDQHGELNRNRLRQIIFNDADALSWVNNLLHPLIHQQTKAQFSRINAPYLIWVIPLLIENHLQDQADRILVVESNLQTQQARLKKRDKINENMVQNMLSSQTTNEIRRRYANDVIENNGELETLQPVVEKLHRQYLELAKNHHVTRVD